MEKNRHISGQKKKKEEIYTLLVLNLLIPVFFFSFLTILLLDYSFSL